MRAAKSRQGPGNAVIAEVRTSLNISDFRQNDIENKKWEIAQHCMLWEFGTNSVQLRERKNGFLVPKRHRMKHLDFLSFLLESRRSAVQNHSPYHSFYVSGRSLLSSIIHAAFDDADFGQFSVLGAASANEGTMGP